jgi:hypothetical protein
MPINENVFKALTELLAVKSAKAATESATGGIDCTEDLGEAIIITGQKPPEKA